MISVIIPSYNRSDTLPRSIKSVLNQTYTDLECIVVDDCSTDNTKQIVQGINDSRLRYTEHKVNQGACAARNTGIGLARGEYIAFQDSDDVWKKDKLQIQLDKMAEYNAVISYGCLHRHGFPSNEPEFFPEMETGIVPYEQLISKAGVSTQTILAKREVFQKHLFDVKVKRMQDYDWMIRAGENNRVVFVREAEVDTYFQPNSITNTGYKALISSNEYFLKKYTDKEEKYPEFRVALLERIGYIKTMEGDNASVEYRAVYELKKSSRTWLRWICAKTGLLKFLWRHKKH